MMLLRNAAGTSQVWRHLVVVLCWNGRKLFWCLRTVASFVGYLWGSRSLLLKVSADPLKWVVGCVIAFAAAQKGSVCDWWDSKFFGKLVLLRRGVVFHSRFQS